MATIEFEKNTQNPNSDLIKNCINSTYGLTGYNPTSLTGYNPTSLYIDDYYGPGSISSRYNCFDPYSRSDLLITNEAARKMIGLLKPHSKTKNKPDFKEEHKMIIKKIIFADNKNKTILFTSDGSYQQKTIVTKSLNETAFVNDADLIRFAYVKSKAPKSTWEIVSEIPIPEDEESQHRLVKKLEKAFLSRSRYLSLERELKYIFFEMPAKKRKSVIVYQNRK